LESLDDDARAELGGADGDFVVRTAFELEPSVRGRLTRALHEHLAAEVDVEYERSEALYCGVELARGGRRLGWSLADYLDELGNDLSQRLEQAAGPERG
jgi:F-type H+-transporting ATPase subunit b